jgi:hypothetical protein
MNGNGTAEISSGLVSPRVEKKLLLQTDQGWSAVTVQIFARKLLQTIIL